MTPSNANTSGLDVVWKILEDIPAINDLGSQLQEDIQAALLKALNHSQKKSWTPGQHLHALRMAFFNGGGWADAPEWTDYDETGHAQWEKLAKSVAAIDNSALADEGLIKVVAYSDAKTLEEIASDTHPGGRFITISRHQQGEGSVALVTAASAQARIAELSASMTQQADQWSERLIVMADRAAAAEARADRLAKALEPFASLALDEANDVKGVSMSDPISKWLTVAQLVDARAALQQEG